MTLRSAGIGKTDIAWAAGYIDGEGCISAYKVLRITVSSTNCQSLDRLLGLFGGSINGPHTPPSKPGQRPWWAWSICGPAAKRALKRILPYLTIKASEATIALTFPLGSQGKKPNSYTMSHRREIDAELRRLKRV